MNKTDWMSEWMDRPVPHDEIGTLYLGRFADPMYFVTKPLLWTPRSNQEGFSPVKVPIGFVTDLASIPRVFWSLLRPDGNYAWGAVVHDRLYWEQTTTREMADSILKSIMQAFKVPFWAVESIYYALRIGGQAAWDANAKLKAAGAKRVLTRFPESPLTTWAEWQTQPGVFANNS